MRRLATTLLASACSAWAAHAEPIARDVSLVESLKVEGVSLATSPEDAFNILLAAGYRAGDIATYESWGEGSLNFVRGAYGAPEGYSSITLGRADGRLVLITQSLNKMGIDAAGEIGAVQSHFGIAGDEPDCRMNRAGTGGACQLSDAADPTEATVKFTMTAQTMMILQSVSRPADLIKTME
ncbi:MAG: hypothetical protein AAFX08_12605 [Pseudomonadota bacterium]